MRLIDERQVIAYMVGRKNIFKVMCLDDVIQMLKDAPTVDAEPVVHAQWKKNEWGEQVCTHCGGIVCNDTDECIVICQYDYCPSCGAKMDEEAEQ